jgi:hypothetical protein
MPPKSKVKKIKKIKMKNLLEIDNDSRKTLEQECKQLFDLIKDSNDILKIETDKYFKIKKCQSVRNKDELKKNKDNTLYPHLDDPNFNVKITSKKEFFDTKVEKFTRKQINNIEQETNKICDPNREFELRPHQMFIRNFLSFQTPYNSLLLFHGLGTGKTCSSISVCEEMRNYNKQLGNTKKIIIVASPTVQENYRLQLFDSRKLKNINGIWNLKSCTGNKLINEINPMQMKGLSREKIIQQINKIINQSYMFLGYTGFANYINNIVKKNQPRDNDTIKKRRNKIKSIRREFSNRLIVIDEVHNIRTVEGLKGTSEKFLELVTYSQNVKLLLLTATPMFNDYREIIWLINLMNLNDDRYPVFIKDIFNNKGDFTKNGKEILIQKLTGYVSYVRGEHPFYFPFRIWPSDSKNPHSLMSLIKGGFRYPTTQINGNSINNPISLLDVVYTKIGSEQQKSYDFLINKLKAQGNIKSEHTGVQYTFLDKPLQCLNMSYPYDLTKIKMSGKEEQRLYGKGGLNRNMDYSRKKKNLFKFSYKKETIAQFGRIFSLNVISKYSGKIFNIMNNILKSKGIVMIYSQFIDGGCIPLALALEEIGFQRYGDNKSLFKNNPTPNIDAITMKPKGNGETVFKPAKYIMITGDKYLSGPNISINNKNELKAATNSDNINGEKVKVIIISRAGSEGLDFRNVRQMHILEPWYNLNRTEQIIGRAVRNKSHCDLPFNERNVQIFLYGTQLNDDTTESADMYMYRLAEKKSIQIGKISRILKENAIDCLLNKNLQDFTEKKMNKKVKLLLSSGDDIDFSLGDKNNSIICDFMNCDYKCNPTNKMPENIDISTYNENFIIMNIDKILQRIRLLFKEKYFYEKKELIKSINAVKSYPIDQIMTGLDYLINNKNEYITDFKNYNGRLINIGDYYLFQPIELENSNIEVFKRKAPIDYKRDSLVYLVPKNFNKSQKETKLNVKISDDVGITSFLQKLQQQYEILNDPVNTIKFYDDRKNAKDWTYYASWAIFSLIKYNKIDKKMLIELAIEHIIDSLRYKQKFMLASYLYSNNSKDDISKELFNIIKRCYDKYVFEKSGVKSIVLVNFSLPGNRTQSKLSIIKINEGELIENDRRTIATVGLYILEKLLIHDDDINEMIGFMDFFKKSNILFKIKNMKEKKGKYSNKGKVCTSGVNKINIVNRIKNLSYPKYVLNKSIIKEIKDVNGKAFPKKEYTQHYEDNEGNLNKVNITSEQLCIETELLLRIKDKENKNGKRWFFSTLENVRNNIVSK